MGAWTVSHQSLSLCSLRGHQCDMQSTQHSWTVELSLDGLHCPLDREGTGEDPYLAGEWAYQYVKGLQEGEDPTIRKLLAVCKHFVAYDLESWGPSQDGCKPGDSCWRERGDFNAVIPRDQISSYYLPAFRRCIRDANAGGVMCSFNAVNGVPSCANPLYLNKTLRSEFNFSGFVVTDCTTLRFF